MAFYNTFFGKWFGGGFGRGFGGRGFWRGLGWQRWWRFIWQIENAQGKWPSGYCICPKCGYKVAHQLGVPCSQISCPNCNINLVRE